MISRRILVLPLLVSILGLACNNADKPKSTTNSSSSTNANTSETTAKSTNNAPKAPAATVQQANALPDPFTGTVKETMDAGGYSYVHLERPGQTIWAAARKFPVQVGDEVEIRGLMEMKGFKSATLDRTFDTIQFVSSARVLGGTGGAATTAPAPMHGSAPSAPMQPHGRTNAATPPTDIAVSKLADGITVAELFEQKSALNGQTVKFRGRVVKANTGILNRNWLHIQDGTGSAGANDITVTSAEGFAAVGSVVVIEGTLGLDRDFGAGYTYDVIVEDATVTPDSPNG